MKNKLRFLGTAIVFAIILSTIALAHPGRTDSNGGHYDHNSGEYHYHHGYEAHQHTGGVCPFDFDDRTGWNSGSSSASTSDDSFISSLNDTQETERKSSWLIEFLMTLTVLLICIAGFWIIALFCQLIQWLKGRKKRKEWNVKRSALLVEYGHISKYSLAVSCDMPEDTFLDSNGLPCNRGNSKSQYTYYIARNGSVFHSTTKCNKAAIFPCNAVRLHGKRPCSRCCPNLPDLDWYTKYSNKLSELERYKIYLPSQDTPS